MNTDITFMIIKIPVLLFAITIHEYSHGKAALSLGDPTAKNAGRLSLNPISHIDLLGALCFYLFHFGWAKPVPINTRYFKNLRQDTILVSISGPIANISAAFVAGLFFRYFPLNWDIYKGVLLYMIIMNVGLGLFNLLPLPPLDGSHIIENLLPPKAAITYRKIGRYVPFILISILMLDRFYSTGIIEGVIGYPIKFLTNFFAGRVIFPL